MSNEYVLFLVMYLVGLMIRAGYELLKKSGRADPKNVTIFAVVFVAMCMMWAGWFNMCPLDPFSLALPGWVRWIGFGLVAVGLGLSIGAVAQLRGVENIGHLVTTGLYSRIRHPMYAGFILWIFGWAMVHGAVLSLAVGFVGIGNILNWRQLEEAELESRYGENYLGYRKGTWF